MSASYVEVALTTSFGVIAMRQTALHDAPAATSAPSLVVKNMSPRDRTSAKVRRTAPWRLYGIPYMHDLHEVETQHEKQRDEDKESAQESHAQNQIRSHMLHCIRSNRCSQRCQAIHDCTLEAVRVRDQLHAVAALAGECKVFALERGEPVCM